LGNSSAFGKVFSELKSLRLVDRVPRLAIINAAGAGTLDHLYNERGLRWNAGDYDSQQAAGYFAQMQGSGRRASTVASAIEINLPVNLSKCLRALEVMDGVVRSVSDAEILDAKALIAKYGFGCEPASGACIAGVRQLRQEGIIGVRDVVACVLTGHLLKDPTATVGYHTDPHWRDKVSIGEPKFANQPIVVPNNIEAIMMAIQERH
jgi:threonine synthase